MLKHKYFLRLSFFVLLSLFIVQQFWIPFSNWIYLLYFIPYTALLIYAAMNLDLNFYSENIIEAKTNKNQIALTFDDGPDEIQTNKVLDILAAYKVKACFFCIGKKIKANDKTLLRIHKEEHIIGNHSFYHDMRLDLFLTNYVNKELLDTNAVINKIIGKTPKFFRPPFGVTTPFIGKSIEHLGMNLIGWNNRSFDTSPFGDDILLDRMQKALKPGGIILLHDIIARQESLLPKLIELIKKNDFEIVRLDHLLNEPAYV